MLCVLTTDAVARRRPTWTPRCATPSRVTFDRLDADGCMSTNDTVLLLASGASGVAPTPADFAAALTEVCADLARQLLADAEGATKEVTIEVVGAASEDDAVEVGRAVARNNLLKCALFGNDPNWGRVLAAIGTTGGRVRARPARRRHQRRLGLPRRRGRRRAVQGRPDRPATSRSPSTCTPGPHTATIWTNDLSTAYVHENSAYSS